jgi:hypothetical protein
MAAGAGFKTFATGDVLTAADTNGYLMQGIWVFANATARDAAVTSPQEGNACYLKDTDAVQTYSGSAWVSVGGGGLSSPLTTKGDVWGYSTTNARIPVGTNGQVLTADSTAALGVKWGGAGKVLQVVNATYSTETTSSTTTLADTGLTASITPSSSSSKILVIVNQNGLYKSSQSASNGVKLALLRGSTSLVTFAIQDALTGTAIQNNTASGTNYLDSPATTSSVTYKTQFANAAAVNIVGVQVSSATSTITLMEIGA